jgi:penicillin-binding protein 1A
MKRVTGGGAPAEIWRAFMAPVLPHLQAQTIPGGAAPVAQPDLIGNMLSGNNVPAQPAPGPIPDEVPQPSAAPPERPAASGPPI